MRRHLAASLVMGLVWANCVHSQPRSAAAAAASRGMLPAAPARSVKTGDWAQWRGPNRDAICTETGLLREWPDGGPKLVWNAKNVNNGKNVGSGYASIVIANGRIYTLGDRDNVPDSDPKEKRGCVICLEEATGKVLWVTPFCKPYGGDGPRSTPTVAGNRVYGLSPHGDLVCLDAVSGSHLWQKDLKKDFGGRMMSGWNYSESPLVDGNKLVCVPGGKDAGVAALNKETGDVLWKCALPKDCGAGYASIVITNAGGVRQYVTLMGPQLGLVGVNSENGKFLWHYSKVANGTANIPTPIVHDDQIFASTAYGTGSALLELGSDGNGGVEAKEVYFLKGKQLQNHHGGMVLLGDYVYGGHDHNKGFPFCLEMKSGKMAWGPERGPGDGSAAVLYADGHLYFRYQDNTMALIEATPKGYHLKGSFKLPQGTSSPGWQHPVIHQGKLFIRANDQLYCYDIKQR
jgi:outer membrane protein assembly factor BamB